MLRKLLASGMKSASDRPEDESHRRCHSIAEERVEGEGEIRENSI
jgi:hypothetical protein